MFFENLAHPFQQLTHRLGILFVEAADPNLREQRFPDVTEVAPTDDQGGWARRGWRF